MADVGLTVLSIHLKRVGNQIRGSITGTDAQGRTAILARDWPTADFPAAVTDLAPVIIEMEYEARNRETEES